ncbi:hypothetical protein IID04_07710 [PVC group bacterium]|nr:hypothetical protein [PVC group bacterium]
MMKKRVQNSKNMIILAGVWVCILLIYFGWNRPRQKHLSDVAYHLDSVQNNISQLSQSTLVLDKLLKQIAFQKDEIHVVEAKFSSRKEVSVWLKELSHILRSDDIDVLSLEPSGSWLNLNDRYQYLVIHARVASRFTGLGEFFRSLREKAPYIKMDRIQISSPENNDGWLGCDIEFKCYQRIEYKI